MGTLKQDTFIRGLHVYKKKLSPGDTLTVALDWFWINENPKRFSVAVFDSKLRKVKSFTIFFSFPSPHIMMYTKNIRYLMELL